MDPVDRLLDAAEAGRSVIRNRDILHFAYIPERIPHRDPEQEQVAQSLLPVLKRSRPSNLLVYGKPGTGKTLVVKKVISRIRDRVERSEFPIRLAYTNSKNETTLYGLLVHMGRQLGLEKKELPPTGLAIGEILKRVLGRISDGGLNVIFVIDEIDHLVQLIAKTHNDVLYQLTRANEGLESGSLTLVGISNDLTFKDRLDPRVLSSLGEEEIVFQNYDVEQLKKILEERIEEAFVPGSVRQPALNLCAAMAGGEHGDARRAIDLIRVAGEVAERRQADAVTEEHVREASRKMEENKEEASLKSYPLHEKLVILAVMRGGGTSTGEIYASYKGLCRSVGREALTQRRVTQMLSEIALSGIISGKMVYQGTHGNTKKYKLTVPPETVKRTFAGDLTLQDVV